MKLFISIIFLGALIGLGTMIGRGAPMPPASLQPKTADTPTTTAADGGQVSTELPKTELAQGGGAPTGRLVTLLKEGQTTKVQTVDVVTKQQKTIFTDQNSNQKIQTVSPISADGGTLLVLMAAEGELAGRLVSVKTDGSGQMTTLIDNFVSTGTPVLSPDQTKIASIAFANTEADFGFSLVIQDVNGANKKVVAKNEAGISRLAFSPDGSQIAYIAGSLTVAETITVVSLADSKESVLYKASGRIIQDFSWNQTGLLAVVTSAVDDRTASATDISLVDRQNNSSVQVTSNEKAEQTAYLAPDVTGVAYIEVVTNKAQPGEVVVVLPTGAAFARLGKANQILGWIR